MSKKKIGGEVEGSDLPAAQGASTIVYLAFKDLKPSGDDVEILAGVKKGIAIAAAKVIDAFTNADKLVDFGAIFEAKITAYRDYIKTQNDLKAIMQTCQGLAMRRLIECFDVAVQGLSAMAIQGYDVRIDRLPVLKKHEGVL